MLNQGQELRRRVVEILSMEELYCKDNGCQSVDLTALTKIVMIQCLFGISLLRRTMEGIKVNVAYC